MADRSGQLVLQALSRAAAESAAVPLFAGRTTPGLFPTTPAGKQAAQRCRDEGLLQDAGARGPSPLCTLTDKGREYLLDQLSPRQVLEDFVRVLEARESQTSQIASQVRQMQAGLEAMRQQVAAVLEQVSGQHSGELNGLFRAFHEEADLGAAVTEALAQRDSAGDYPLPELFRVLASVHADLSIGAFHDALRRLEGEARIYLHPWTGPLYALPEPAFGLLVGHQIAYYASGRSA